MHIRKIMVLMLCGAFVCGTVACGTDQKQEQVTEVRMDSETTESTEVTETVTIDPEVMRGVTLGLVDASYLDYAEAWGTTEDIEKMVSKILELRGAGEDKITEWENLATGKDITAYNSDVAKACYYTAVYLSKDGIPKTNANDNSGAKRVLAADWRRDPKTIENNGFIQCAMGEYSFYNREKGYHAEDPLETNEYNHVTAGMFAPAMASHYSGQYVLPQDPETDTLLLNTPLNREELLLRMVRIYDCFEDPAEYISIDSLGDSNVFTDEEIAAAAPVPEVDENGYSDEWIGSCMENYETVGCIGADGSLVMPDLTWNYREADFAATADLGTNYIRLQIYLPSFSFPDYSQDRTKVNKAIIEDLDRAIGWGMKYGQHISLAFMGYMDDDFDGVNEGSSVFTPPIMATKEQYAAKRDFIEQIAKRYRNVPAKYLSFELENEVSQDDRGAKQAPTHSGDELADEYISIAKEVWNVTPGRGISMSSDKGKLSEKEKAFWIKIAEAGINLDYHSYEPRSFMAPREGEMVAIDKMVWPFVDENGVEWDMDKVYDEYIAPWKQLADEYGVGFKIGECVPFLESWDIYETPPRTQQAMVAFANDFSKKLQENHISYTLNNTCNGFSAVHDVEPADTDIHGYINDAEYTYKTYHLENYTCSFYVNEEYAKACYDKK